MGGWRSLLVGLRGDEERGRAGLRYLVGGLKLVV